MSGGGSVAQRGMGSVACRGLQWERTGCQPIASTVQMCRWDWEKKIYVGGVKAYWHILVCAILSLIFTSSAPYTNIKGEAVQPLWRWVRVLHYATHIPSPSFSFFIPKVCTRTLALEYLLSIAGWSSLFVVTFSVEDTVLCNVRKVASFQCALLSASPRFPKAKNLRNARTIEPCLFMGWKPVPKATCVRQRENCPWLISSVNDRGSSVLLKTVTDNRPFGLSSSRARHPETIVRERLRLQHFPKLSEYTDFATAFCIKRWVKSIPIKRKQNQDGFEKNHVLSLHVGIHAFYFLQPIPFSGSGV